MERWTPGEGEKTGMIKRVFRHVRHRVWQRRHERLRAEWRRAFRNPGVTILSSNCTSGILYNDLGLQYRSPTINLYMRGADFITFCERLDHYLAVQTLVPCRDPAIIGERTYPVAWLDDLLVFFVHYRDLVEAQEKWDRRKKRVNPEHIAVIHTDREGMTEELKDRFERLPYRKVMFVHQPDDRHPSCVMLPGWEREESVGIITDPVGWKGLRPVDRFDWVSFLNGD